MSYRGGTEGDGCGAVLAGVLRGLVALDWVSLRRLMVAEPEGLLIRGLRIEPRG